MITTHAQIILFVLTAVRLHLLGRFHCGYLSPLQVVPTANVRGIRPPTASGRRPATRRGDRPTRRETASIPTGCTSGTAACSISGTAACSISGTPTSSISGTTACHDGNASSGLQPTATTRRNPEMKSPAKNHYVR